MTSLTKATRETRPATAAATLIFIFVAIHEQFSLLALDDAKVWTEIRFMPVALLDTVFQPNISSQRLAFQFSFPVLLLQLSLVLEEFHIIFDTISMGLLRWRSIPWIAEIQFSNRTTNFSNWFRDYLPSNERTHCGIYPLILEDINWLN